jgi:fluoroacetyl-CoA thioesterase
MKDTLTVGLEGQANHTVTADMSPPHLARPVLGTPAMVQLIEGTCLQAAQSHLDDNETTVGIHICVSHSAAASEGEEVTVSYRLSEIDRRRLVFETTVTCGDRVLSEGTHQRFVVDTSSFGG